MSEETQKYSITKGIAPSAVALVLLLATLPAALLYVARAQELFGLGWSQAIPSVQDVIVRVLLLQITLLGLGVTRSVFHGYGILSPRLRMALLSAYGVLVATSLAALVLLFLDPGSHTWLRDIVFAARVLALPLFAFAAYGFLRMFERLETHLNNEKVLSAQFYKQSTTDALTGLPNRFLFTTMLTQALARADRQKSGLAVLLIDLDRFKIINDSLGRDEGDLVLREIAHRIRGSLRQADVLCRSGGDEFIVFAEGLSTREQLSSLLDRLLSELAKSLQVGGQEVFPTASIGASFYPRDGTDAASLVRNADQAMHAAKTAGPNVVTFYRPDLHPVDPRRLALESELRRALRNHELFLQYQPVVNSTTQRMVGLEALVRWRHPEKGLINPADFIPAAEESSLIVPLDRWVIRSACAQLAVWRRAGFTDLRMATNLSVRSFYRDDLVHTVEEALRENGLPGSVLDLEITENAVLEESPEVVERLHGLRALGVSIVIDDFGTGYSSLGYLSHFPIDAIKFDRSLVIQTATDARANAVVSGVAAIGKALGLRVVAEGVERPEQLAVVLGLGCRYVQGFIFSRPVDPADIEVLIREQNRVGTIKHAAA